LEPPTNLTAVFYKLKYKNMTKIAINGLGRIGRATFKVAFDKPDIEVVAINDLGSAESLAYLLKYDSVYGRWGKEVEARDGKIIVDGREFPILQEKDPAKLPWQDMGVDVVIESTGVFTKKSKARAHIQAGTKRVIISAPSKKDDPAATYLFGVNEEEYNGDEIIDMASCTTNCIGPVMKIMCDKFGVEKSLLVTIHAYTATQSLVDGPNEKDERRGRAAAQNSVPSTTGAAIATTKALPELQDKFDGTAVRIPVVCGSLIDVTMVLKKDTTAEEINKSFADAAQGDLKGILGVAKDPIVSSDVIQTTESSIVDPEYTKVVGGNLAKVVAWYDNEWAYSVRLNDMASLIGKSLDKK